MNRQVRALVLTLFATPAFAGDGDFGAWGEIAVTKRLPYNLSVGLDAEVRGNDNLQCLDRWNIGASVGYKPLKWLKLSAGYVFMQSYKPESRKDKYKGEDNYPDRIGNPEYWKGYNITESYMSPRHRLVAAATFTSPKLWRWIRVSLRERYQCTWRPEQEVGRTKYRYYKTGDEDFDLERDGYRYKLDDVLEHDYDIKESKHTQSLRSRLKVEMDKKRIHWHPFVSFEFFNDLEDGLRLSDYRASIGTTWDVTRNQSIGAAYIYNVERDMAGDLRQHVLSLSYDYKF